MSIRPHLIRVSDNTIFDIDGEMTIGRKSTCDIILDTEIGISRAHARLVAGNGQFLLNDLGSTNGTMVNGVAITTETALNDGDILRFDTLDYRVVLPDTAPVVAAVAEEDDDRTVMQARAPIPAAPDAPTQLAPNTPAAAPPAAPPAQAQPAPSQAQPAAADNAAAGGRQPYFQEVAGEHTVIAGRQAVDPDMFNKTDASNYSHPVLLVRSGDRKGAELPLSDDADSWTIGTAPDSSLRLTDSGVSARHAQLTQEGKQWKLVDQMSINGTYVNGEQVNLRFVNSGDFLRFGPVDCELIIPAGSARKRRRKQSDNSSGGGGALKWWIIGGLLVLLLIGAGVFAWTQGLLGDIA